MSPKAVQRRPLELQTYLIRLKKHPLHQVRGLGRARRKSRLLWHAGDWTWRSWLAVACSRAVAGPWGAIVHLILVGFTDRRDLGKRWLA